MTSIDPVGDRDRTLDDRSGPGRRSRALKQQGARVSPRRKVNSVNVPSLTVDADAVAGVVAACGLSVSVVCQAKVLANQALFAVQIDHDAHDRRTRTGVGPEVDGRLLAMWEWPESYPTAPPSVVRVEAILVRASRWRSGLQRARRWGAFAPSGLLTPSLRADIAEECALECRFAGVGLVINDDAGPDPRVTIPPVRCSPTARRTADRWLEEALYEQLLNQQILTSFVE